MNKRTICAFAILLLLCSHSALAQDDSRTILRTSWATPLQDGLLLPPETSIECTPDAFIEAFLGTAEHAALAPVFSQLSYAYNEPYVSFDGLVDDGACVYLRSDESIRRESLPSISVGDALLDVELVVLGMPYYYNMAFVFVRTQDTPWTLRTCLYQFQDATIESCSDTAWLVGLGECSGTQEGEYYAQWYNLKTNTVDVSYITSASKIASIEDGTDLYSADMISRTVFSAYTYEDEQGQTVVDCGLSVISYHCLALWENHYTSNGFTQVRQVDALTVADVYVYNTETSRLEHAMTRAFENASPAFVERGHHWLLDEVAFQG